MQFPPLPPPLLSQSGPRRLIDPDRHTLWPIICQESKDAVMRVLDRGVLSGPFAPESRAFEEEFADFVSARHALLTHSGTSALVIALASAGVGPGDEVIVPAYTFVATPLAVVACGARPVFADVSETTGLIDSAEIERWATERTRAIMPVHVHGCPADMSELVTLAGRLGAVVVEDAAQAHGATYQGQKVGALAQGGGFSLQSSKNLGCGEGGVFVTNSFDQAELANSVRNFGQDLHLSEAAMVPKARPLDGWRSMPSQRPGGMYRGNEMLAALARVQLRRLPERTRLCQENASRLTERLQRLAGLRGPAVPEDRTCVHHKYRVSIDPVAAGLDDFSPSLIRDAIVAAMKATGLEVTLWERTYQTAQAVFRGDETALPHLQENYRSVFPKTQQLLDSSFILFTQSCPLIAQTPETVNSYADAIDELWHHRRAIVESYGLAQSNA